MDIDARIHEQAVAIERVHFVKTDKRVNSKKVTPFLYLKGSRGVLISAPHAVRYVNGKAIKSSDEYTGSIAYLLHRLTDCHSLAVTKLYGGDPSSDAVCLYKEKVAQICQQQDLELIIDLHGAPRSQDFDVAIKLPHGQASLKKKGLLVLMQSRLAEAGLVQFTVDETPNLGPHTVAAFVAHQLGLPAVQLEINRRFRAPRQNGRDFATMLQALVAIVRSMGR